MNIAKANPPRLHSLRKRAILFSATISLLIVGISIVGYSNFQSLHTESSLSLLKRDELLVRFSAIRSELLEAYKSLNNFLLNPENNNYQNNIHIRVREALRISSEINKHEWIIKYNRKISADKLIERLELLDKEIVGLINVRLDTSNQYPSLAVGAQTMQPNRDKLNNAISLALNEMTVDNTQAKNPNIYNAVIQARHLWSQVLSNSRLYLANRVGSFNKDALPIQEKSIEVMYSELHLNLLKLKAFADEGKLGFETTDAVESMLESASAWFEGYKKVKIINHSDEWRQDATIMKNTISPIIDSIIQLLMNLEQIITESSKDEVELVRSLGNTQNIISWMIALLGIFFTIVITISLDKLIFSPIAAISRALKLEALGKESENLPIVKAKETEDLVNAFSEMSSKVRTRQIELEYHALHDSLTSLPNRTLLLNRIAYNIRASKRDERNFSLLILDLDDFKEVNDTLGHIAGDNLLIKVGDRVKNVLRDVDTVARIGGDEFSILLPNTGEEQSIIISKKILSSFSEIFSVEGVDVSISASIGIAIYPEHGDDVQTLLRCADIAMYVAKRNKLGCKVYSKDEDDHSLSRLSMTRDFRDAMANDKLSVNFQPVYDISNQKIIAVEALSRWYHPEHGFVSPEKFISLAEQTGLINSLTYWVLDKAVEQVAKWNGLGFQLSVAVNLSVYSFKDPEFIGEVHSVLKKYDFPEEYLKLEITEGAMMENPLHAIEVLTELHSMGIKLSIDDYGTGFSSMTYLKQLPVDELKIDKSFVIGLDSDESNDAIVRSTIDLAHNLGLKVVAEGIETEKVYKLLQEYNCDLAQGFHLSRPVPAEDVEVLLKVN